MHRRGQILKLTAVSVLVVMALTGFKARGHGHHSNSHSGGGGCSSSSQDHDGSSSSTSGGGYGSGKHDYDDDDDYSGGTSGGSGSGSGVSGRDGQVTLVSCATKKAPYATVEVTNPNKNYQTFTVEVSFYDAGKKVLAEREQEVGVGPHSTATAQVPVDDAKLLPLVDHCEVVPYASWTS